MLGIALLPPGADRWEAVLICLLVTLQGRHRDAGALRDLRQGEQLLFGGRWLVRRLGLCHVCLHASSAGNGDECARTGCGRLNKTPSLSNDRGHMSIVDAARREPRHGTGAAMCYRSLTESVQRELPPRRQSAAALRPAITTGDAELT